MIFFHKDVIIVKNMSKHNLIQYCETVLQIYITVFIPNTIVLSQKVIQHRSPEFVSCLGDFP